MTDRTDRGSRRPAPRAATPDSVVARALALLGLGDTPPDGAADEAAAQDLVAAATLGVALGTDRPEAIVPVAPPPGLRARLLERIQREQRFQFVHGDEGAWTPCDDDPSASCKLLYQGATPAERTRLVRLPTGDARAALALAHDPALVVVEGELWRDQVRCTPGDFAQPLGDASVWRAAVPTTVLVVERGMPDATSDATSDATATPNGPPRRRAPVIPAGREGWRPLAPGVRVRPLAAGPAESVDVVLLEMDVDCVLPEHEHGGLEEIFLLRGSCRAQGQVIRAGDYHRAAHGSEHEDTTTDEGCLMVVVLRKAA